MSKIKIADVEYMPSFDSIGRPSYPVLALYPCNAPRVEVHYVKAFRSSIGDDEYHDRIAVVPIPINDVDAEAPVLDESAVRTYLESPEAQDKLQTAVDGYSEFDRRGAWSPEAQVALEELVDAIGDIPTAGVLYTADGFGDFPPDELTSETTDEELRALAEQCLRESEADGEYIDGGADAVEFVLQGRREDLREDATE